MGIYWPYIVSVNELNKLCGCQRISTAVKRRRWKWLGHVLQMQKHHHCATALTWAPVGKRKVGRPKTPWRRRVEKERSDAGWWSWEQVRACARDRDRDSWRKRVEALCANENEDVR